MQAIQTENERFYQSGFRKQMNRNKFNLPISERLKECRTAKKLSGAQVVREMKARGVNIGNSSLNGYEAPETSMNHRYPSLINMIALADIYEVSLDYLFGRTDSKLQYKDMYSKKGLNKNLKLLFNSGEDILWGRIKITAKQCKLLKAHVELMLNRQV
jgi:transcriptional regulator with XRE-family HTH domain